MALGGESQEAAGRQHAHHLRQHRGEVVQIDEHVGSDHQIGAGRALAAQAVDDLGDFQLGIVARGAGALDHPRRQVDAGHRAGGGGKGRAGKAGAAAEIDATAETHRPLARGADGEHRLEQHRRPAIAQRLHQSTFEFRRILVEQRRDVGRRHFRQRPGTQPHQPQTGAVAVAGIGIPGMAERDDRARQIAQRLAHLAEREPGGGKARRQIGGLHEQVLGGDQIALHLQVAGIIEAAVGVHIAG